MTEQEALKYLKDANRNNQMVGILPKSDIGKCLIKALEEIQQYRAIGTVEECRAAVEKQKAIKPHKNFERFSGVWCSCGKYLGKGYFVDKSNYCSDCGAKLDWRDE